MRIATTLFFLAQTILLSSDVAYAETNAFTYLSQPTPGVLAGVSICFALLVITGLRFEIFGPAIAIPFILCAGATSFATSQNLLTSKLMFFPVLAMFAALFSLLMVFDREKLPLNWTLSVHIGFMLVPLVIHPLFA